MGKAAQLLRAPVAVAAALACAGCTAMQPAGFSRELGDAARQLAASMADQAVWQTLVGRLEGQVIEPGVVVYGGVLYVAGARLTGASGRVELAGEGVGSGELTAEARRALAEIATRPELLERLAAASEHDEQPE